MIIANIADFREAARRRLPHFLFEYVDGGSYAEETLRRNISDLAGIALRQRVLADVADIDLSAELFGRSLAMPVALAVARPPASGRFDNTSTISAGQVLSFAASISAAMLEPRPEIRTATRLRLMSYPARSRVPS